jgi:hypothetical protein
MGCAREVYNITWTGVVANKETKLPVTYAQIWATCSFQQNIDETGEVQKYALSDEYGRFKLSFLRGFGLKVNTSASGFLSGLDYKVVKKSSLIDTIFISPQPFNASLVVRVQNNRDYFSPRSPFIRQSIVQTEGKGDRKSIIYWGYDFLNGTNTNNLDSADVWLEINQSNNQMVLKSSQKGGVFAVFKPEHSDFITQVTRAPETGYARHHVMTGTEAGFFVLCRNGTHVAKLIPQERICEITYREKNQIISEKGIRFDYLFQPDLENRLFFPVSASAPTTFPRRDLDDLLKIQSPKSSTD